MMGAMRFVTTTQQQTARLICDRLYELLTLQPVTWFVSGGSNINTQLEALRELEARGSNLEHLTIMLIDERFGDVGHIDSNWAQLEQAGFMIAGPTYIAPYTSAEKTLAEAVVRYEAILQERYNGGDYLFAQLGMGDDGHTSGILPGSQAAAEIAPLVTGYERGPYQRLTTTFAALRRLNEIALVAFGSQKAAQLARLTETIPLQEQPVQIIKDIPLVTIYTDYIPD